MPELLVDRRRRTVAGFLESTLIWSVSVGFALFPATVLFYPAADPLEWVVALAMSAAAAIAAFMALWHFLGGERVWLEQAHLGILRWLGPLRRQWSVPLADILSVEVPSAGREVFNTSWGLGGASVLIKTASRTYPCCIAVSPAEAQEVAERIRHALAR